MKSVKSQYTISLYEII